jgi:DNA-binding NarL/FixJ family response regulator
VVIADAEPVARCGLRHLIESHEALRLCAEAEHLPLARELCVKHKPAVLVLDPAMGDGFAFIRDLRRWSARTQVVAFTALGDAASVQRAFKAGACGYVTRRDPVAALLGAIVGAVSGERHVGPGVERVLLEKLATGGVEMRGEMETTLSMRELEVFRLLGAGRETREVASALRLSVKTIESHQQRIKEKLRLLSGAELRRRAALFVSVAS